MRNGQSNTMRPRSEKMPTNIPTETHNVPACCCDSRFFWWSSSPSPSDTTSRLLCLFVWSQTKSVGSQHEKWKIKCQTRCTWQHHNLLVGKEKDGAETCKEGRRLKVRLRPSWKCERVKGRKPRNKLVWVAHSFGGEKQNTEGRNKKAWDDKMMYKQQWN